jgi:hypothetical protein
MTYAATLRAARLAATPTAAELEARAARQRQRPIEGISHAELAARLATLLGRDGDGSLVSLAAHISLYESGTREPSWERGHQLLALCGVSAAVLGHEATQAALALAGRWRCLPKDAIRRSVVAELARQRAGEAALENAAISHGNGKKKKRLG